MNIPFNLKGAIKIFYKNTNYLMNGLKDILTQRSAYAFLKNRTPLEKIQ